MPDRRLYFHAFFNHGICFAIFCSTISGCSLFGFLIHDYNLLILGMIPVVVLSDAASFGQSPVFVWIGGHSRIGLWRREIWSGLGVRAGMFIV